MKYECEMIQDLIPLVKDGIASEKSRDAVAQHIKTCAVCQEAYNTDAQISLPTLDDTARDEIHIVSHYTNRIKKRRKIFIISAALLAILLMIATSLITVQFVKLIAGDSYKTRNIDEYGKYTGHIESEQEGFFRPLEVFPKDLPQSATVSDYYYFCNNGLIDNSYQLYLLCSYDQEDFDCEKERLESIRFTFHDVVDKPTITDMGFQYHAVVTIFDNQNSFEYALIDEETKTIAYVFAQSMGIDESVVPAQYRPKRLTPP